MEFYRLEDRILFEAAAAADAVQAGEFDPEGTGFDPRETETASSGDALFVSMDGAPNTGLAADIAESGGVDGPAGSGSFHAEEELIGLTVQDHGATISTGRELVIINASVQDAQNILDSLNPNHDVLMLEDGSDPLRQILDYLEMNGGTYSAMHFVTHGNSGYFVLSGQVIATESLDRDAWVEVGGYLTDGGDILLYGCNLAENEAGRDLVAAIADAAGADVAASTDTTGLGGNWELEFHYGSIESVTISVDDYAYRLNDWLVTLDTDNAYTANGEINGDGEYDLRYAVFKAQNGDSITFDLASNVVTLQAEIEINKNISITGDEAGGEYTTIRVAALYTESPASASNYRLFHVTGGTVSLSKLILAGGSVSGNGGLILAENTATLSLNEMLFTGTRAGSGGAVYCTGAGLFVDGCTFSLNEATVSGAAVFVSGAQTRFISCTFYRNSVTANTAATGVLHFADTVNSGVLSSTFYGNRVNGEGGALYFFGTTVRPVTVINSILTGNTANGAESNLYTDAMNLIYSVYGSESDVVNRYTEECVLAAPEEVFSDTALSAPVSGNPGTIAIRSNGDAAWQGTLVGVLEDNYFFVSGNLWKSLTHSTKFVFNSNMLPGYGLMSGTIFISGGNGINRNNDFTAFSMGAHVLPTVVKSGFVVTTALDWINPFDTAVSLREAVSHVKEDGAVITFDPAIFNSSNDEAAKTIVFSTWLNPQYSLTIRGSGPDSVIFDGGGKSRFFQFNRPNKSFEVSGITFRNGHDIQYGGAIENWRCVLVIDNCVFYGNAADNPDIAYASNGGAVFVGEENAVTEIRNSTFYNNYALQGGAISIKAGGACTLVNCTILGNQSQSDGGGILNYGTLYLINTIITGNYEGNSPVTGASDIFNGGTASLAYTVYGTIRGDAVTMTACESRDVADAFNAQWRLKGGEWELVSIGSDASIFDPVAGVVALTPLGRTSIAGTLTGKVDGHYYFLDGTRWRSLTSGLEFMFNAQAADFGLSDGEVYTLALNGVSRVLTFEAFNPGSFALTPAPGNTVTVSFVPDFESPFFNTIYEAVAYARTNGQYIDFAPGIMHIQLNRGPLRIDYDLEVRGVSTGSVTISGNSADDSIFQVTGSLMLLDGLLLGPGKITGTGNITAHSSLAGSSATVNMTGGAFTYGGSDQTILGGTYNHLVISGAASGGGKAAKQLAGTIDVKGSFAMKGVADSDYIELNGNGFTLTLASYGSAAAPVADIVYTDILNTVFSSTLHLNSTNTAANSNVLIYVTARDLAASGLVYGDTLSDSTVTGSAVARGRIIDGILRFRDGGNMPQVSDSNRTQYALAWEGNPIYVVTGAATVAVAPRQLIIRAEDQSKIFGDADPGLTWTIIDGQLVGADSLTGTLIRVPGETAGSYDILQGTLTGNDNYEIIFINGTLLITEGPPVTTPYNEYRAPRWDNENFTVLPLAAAYDNANLLNRYRMTEPKVEVFRRIIDASDNDDIGIAADGPDFLDGFLQHGLLDLPAFLRPQLQKAERFKNVFDLALEEILEADYL